MARPAYSGRVPSTTLLFRITIRRARGRFPRRLRRRSRLRARRGRPRRYRRSVRFRSRRTLPPFFIFMERHRRRLQRTHPHLNMVQTAKRLGRMWHRLPDADKEMYKEQAFRMKRRRRARRSRSRRPRMPSRRTGMRNLMISFTTKAASLRNFLMSYL